eukprot:TRINITY_DN203_c0_g1_i5.p2 TRINITY_DN203_c0_g1~~TRINITY_DN203_c0_g1_i5.p2  ORF type:complete len:178 (-),score=78.83 TRINITY_DN203_c0_g1_i5:54-524(-)
MLSSRVCIILGLASLVVLCQFLLVTSQTAQKPHYIDGKHNPEAHSGDAKDQEEAVSSYKQFVLDSVNENKVFIFSKSYCPYCKRAKALLESKNIAYKAFELDQEATGPAVHAEVKKITQRNTVPNIWINGKPFGGSDDLQAAAANGKLDELLAAKN